MLYVDFSVQITAPSLIGIECSQHRFSLDTSLENISGDLRVILETAYQVAREDDFKSKNL